MTMTTAELAIQAEVDEKMGTDEAFVRSVQYLYKKLKSGFWEPEYVDVVFQRPTRFGHITVYDAYCFGVVHSMIHGGQIARYQIAVDKGPFADGLEHENNAVLTRLPKPFKAKFIGGYGNSDGSLSWSKPIELAVVKHTPEMPDSEVEKCNEARLVDAPCPHVGHIVKQPSRAPLEVGSTQPWTTLLHLMQNGAVARWPYEAKWITLLIRIGGSGFDIREQIMRRKAGAKP